MELGTLPALDSEAAARLGRLSAKEREVLDQILLHKPLKVIAHELGITLSAVDQRLKAARAKLDAADRNEAARIYSALLAACRESTYGFEDLGSGRHRPLSPESELHSGATFMLRDSATTFVAPPWQDSDNRGAVSEVLDEKFGKAWRVLAIPVFAVAIAVLALALIAMARELGELL